MNRTILQLGTMAVAVAFSTMAFAAGVAVEEAPTTTGKLFDLSKDPAKVMGTEVAPTAKSTGMSFSKTIPGQGQGLQLPGKAAIPSNIATTNNSDALQCDKGVSMKLSSAVGSDMSATDLERASKYLNPSKGPCGKNADDLQVGPRKNAALMARDIADCLHDGPALANPSATAACAVWADEKELENSHAEAKINQGQVAKDCAIFLGVSESEVAKVN